MSHTVNPPAVDPARPHNAEQAATGSPTLNDTEGFDKICSLISTSMHLSCPLHRGLQSSSAHVQLPSATAVAMFVLGPLIQKWVHSAKSESCTGQQVLQRGYTVFCNHISSSTQTRAAHVGMTTASEATSMAIATRVRSKTNRGGDCEHPCAL